MKHKTHDYFYSSINPLQHVYPEHLMTEGQCIIHYLLVEYKE
jgi:hypothetical protein